MTIKLYDDAPYATTFTAMITDVQYTKQNTQLILDRTLFFPEEGGQCADQGFIDEYEIIDVQIDHDIITHTLKGHASYQIGDRIEGKIDWPLRFSNMQNHTGEHIFSGIIHRTYGYDNVGFHLGKDVVTVDLNGPLTEEQLLKAEREVNQVIYDDRKVKCFYPPKEDLVKLDYRSKKPIEGAVRLVEIEGCDLCACCAPHLRHTGEAGLFKIISAMNYKGGVRVSLLCGSRALRAVEETDARMKELHHLLSANNDTVVRYVQELQQKVNALKAENTKLLKDAMAKQIVAINEKRAFLFIKELDKNIQREAVNELMKKTEYCGVFVGDDKRGYRFILGAKEKDCRTIFNLLKEKGAKGGGSKQMVQGFIRLDEAEINKLLH